MASGTDSQVGWDLESSWGTRVAQTHFPRFTTYPVLANDEFVKGQGIQAGQQFEYSGHYVRTDTKPSFTLGFDYQTRDVVGLFNSFFGASSVAQQGGTSAYLHTWSGLGALTNKSFTLQVGVPRQSSTTVDPIELAGAKITEVEFSSGIGELLKVNATGFAKTYDTGQTLSTATYVASEVAPFIQQTVKTGTYGGESTLAGVRSISVRLARPQNADDNSTAGGTKTEPEPNGFATIDGTLEVNYLSTALTTLWRANTAQSLVWEWVGSNIAGAYYQTFRLTLSSIKFQGPGPSSDGPGLVSIPWTFKGGYDGTNPAVKLEIINAETGTTGY